LIEDNMKVKAPVTPKKTGTWTTEGGSTWTWA
jgi:hypothetical protein